MCGLTDAELGFRSTPADEATLREPATGLGYEKFPRFNWALAALSVANGIKRH